MSHNHSLGPEGGEAIAAATSDHASLTALNMENNGLCGLNRSGQGAFTTAAIVEIAQSVARSPITSLSLASNALSDAGALALVDSLRSAVACKVAKLDLRDNNIRVDGGKALAALISAMPTLLELNLRGNKLCGISLDARTQKQVGSFATEAILSLAEAVRSAGALRELNLEENFVDADLRATLEQACKGSQLRLHV